MELQDYFEGITKKIRYGRRVKRLSQKDAGAVIGLSQAQYSKKECNALGQEFTIPEIYALCTELNLDFKEVIKAL